MTPQLELPSTVPDYRGGGVATKRAGVEQRKAGLGHPGAPLPLHGTLAAWNWESKSV